MTLKGPKTHHPDAEVASERSPREDAKELFRLALLNAAEQVFAEQGYQGAHIQQIAKRARVAVGTVYNHFAQKEDILVELVRDRVQQIWKAFQRHPTDPEAFEPQIRARFGRMQRCMSEHLAFFMVACEVGFLGTGSATMHARMVQDRIEQMRLFPDELQKLIDQGIAEGVIEPTDSKRLTLFFLGGLQAVLMTALLDGRPDSETEAEQGLELFLRGFMRRPQSQQS